MARGVQAGEDIINELLTGMPAASSNAPSVSRRLRTVSLTSPAKKAVDVLEGCGQLLWWCF